MNRRDVIKQTALKLMQQGKRITALQFAKKYDTTRLGARIFDLRNEGYKIKTNWKIDKYGERYAEYYI